VNSRGQTIIEAAVALTFLVIAVGGVITVIYLSSLKTWMGHVAYEGAICLAQGKTPSTCENEVKRQIKILNFFSYPLFVNARRTNSLCETNIRLEIFNRQHLNVRQTLPLPLKASSL
jgi:hypothetical protein